jgi:hypothetical protein
VRTVPPEPDPDPPCGVVRDVTGRPAEPEPDPEWVEPPCGVVRVFTGALEEPELELGVELETPCPGLVRVVAGEEVVGAPATTCEPLTWVLTAPAALEA